MELGAGIAMTNTEMLFIRACKSMAPEKRVLSVYRRRYGKNQHPNFAITGILAEICDKYAPITTAKLLSELHHSTDWKYSCCETHWEKSAAILRNHLRFCEVAKFGDSFRKPVRFKV